MEAMVVLGIMTILLMTVNSIFKANDDLVARELRQADTTVGAVQAVRTISEMTRGASDVVAEHDFNGTTHTTSSDTLVLQMPSLDINGSVLGGENDFVAVYRGSGADADKIYLNVVVGLNSARPSGIKALSRYNESLIFRYNDSDVTLANRVSVFLSNVRTYRGSTIRAKAWTAIFLRN